VTSLGLDGKSSTNTVNSGKMTLTLTTSSPNDVLYLSFVGGMSTDISSITSTGGTSGWTQRAYVQTEDSNHHMSTWYATWTSSGTTTITISLSGSSTNCAVVVFGISGAANIASASTIFDGNAQTSPSGTGSTASVSITTTNAHDFVIGALGEPSTSNPTNTLNLIKTQPAANTRLTSDEYTTTATTGTYTPQYTGVNNPWGMVADAIKGT
jgi:hypothetical protein